MHVFEILNSWTGYIIRINIGHLYGYKRRIRFDGFRTHVSKVHDYPDPALNTFANVFFERLWTKSMILVSNWEYFIYEFL